MAILEVNNLNKTYFGGYVATQDVSFTLSSGEVLTVFARLGGGKSTLLKLLSTLETPSSGTIKIDGKDIKDIDIKDLNISFATSELPLMKSRSVYYNLAYPLRIRKVEESEIKQRIASISQLFDLDNILDEGVKYLTKSLKARVILARAFMRESDFYLIDNILEDFTINDREEVLTILSMMIDRVKGGIIYATDRLDEVSLVGGDNCIILSHGKMVDIGRIDDIYHNPSTLDSIRLVSDGTANEFIRKVSCDKSGAYIDLFGKHNIDIDKVYNGKEIIALVNMEDVKLSHANSCENDASNIGIVTKVYVKQCYDVLVVNIKGEEIIAKVESREFKAGEDVCISVDNVKLFDIHAERRIININKGIDNGQ